MGHGNEVKMMTRIERTLPSRYYYDPDHYQKELEAIWYKNWLYVCRSENIGQNGAFRVVTIGNQEIVVTRDKDGGVQAFHNTCRHRGTALCTEKEGHFKGNFIQCPYHAWTYSLKGDLIATPHMCKAENFDKKEYSLYRVAVQEWHGFIFINLQGEKADFSLEMALEVMKADHVLDNWHMEDLRSNFKGEVLQTVKCNWKAWLENFMECYHCPGIHPELAKIVPAHAKGLMEGQEGANTPPSGKVLKAGAVTWSLDGKTNVPYFPHLSEEEKVRGQTFIVLLPSFFVLACVDFVSILRVLPSGPESVEVCWNVIYHPSVLERDDVNLDKTVELARLVIEQDSRICEIQQRGIRCIRHKTGILVPQEEDLLDFHEWVLGMLNGSKAEEEA